MCVTFTRAASAVVTAHACQGVGCEADDDVGLGQLCVSRSRPEVPRSRHGSHFRHLIARLRLLVCGVEICFQGVHQGAVAFVRRMRFEFDA